MSKRYNSNCKDVGCVFVFIFFATAVAHFDNFVTWVDRKDILHPKALDLAAAALADLRLTVTFSLLGFLAYHLIGSLIDF